MQKNTPFFLGLIYSVLFAATVCIVFYGGHIQYLTYAYLIGTLCMFPFIYMAVLMKRNRDGVLAGRDAVKEGLRVVLAATIFMVLFQVIFFRMDFREYKVNFMQTQGPQILKEQIGKGTAKIKESDIPRIISEDVQEVTVFKEITSVVFKNLLFGSFSAFITALLLKKKI